MPDNGREPHSASNASVHAACSVYRVESGLEPGSVSAVGSSDIPWGVWDGMTEAYHRGLVPEGRCCSWEGNRHSD